MENVANSGAAAQFRRLDVLRRPFDRRAVSRGELGDDLSGRRVGEGQGEKRELGRGKEDGEGGKGETMGERWE